MKISLIIFTKNNSKKSNDFFVDKIIIKANTSCTIHDGFSKNNDPDKIPFQRKNFS